jgi:spermidine synthase/MFS family permease
VRPVAFIAFFLSGAASLIFQLIWSRLLHHVFGSSSVAISSVVSVFMGGLALGAWLFGRVADRIKHPLVVYAVVEALVGCAGLLVPLLVNPEGWLAGVNAWLRSQAGAESFEFMLVRFLCIVPVLIVPTTLMGSTLPLLARHFVQQEQAAGVASSRVGVLYAINTAGAVAGVLLAGFVLMPRFGVRITNALAASLNLGLAALVLSARRALTLPVATRPTPEFSEATADRLAEADAAIALPRWARRAAAASFAVSGFASLLYEVVWSRALVNAIGGSIYAFTLILATFLTGIAGGSAYGSSVLSGSAWAGRGVAWATAVLCVLALTPLAVHEGRGAFALASLLGVGAVALVRALTRRRARRLALFDAEPAGLTSAPGVGVSVVALPALLAIGCALHYADRLAWLTLTVVASVVLLLTLLNLLRRQPLLALAGIQLQVALATLGSDLWADELSLTFASMVAPLYEVLPDSVNLVIALMFVTVALCMLPAAFGMGAMFPFTLRVFSAGGQRIGREVGQVYTGNTVGSIVGAWLPGFVCMPLLGMQPTLHLGIGINLVLCLGLCLVWLRVADAGELPARGTAGGAGRAAVWALCAALLAGMALSCVPGVRNASPLTWNLAKLTLGAFRISLARDVIDQEAWGEADLLFYRDGLSTTVSVERWGRHVSLKNNGKVEASNGDDMATQIMVSALPLMLHERGPAGLDAMVVGVGSGVTVGAALQFPLRSLYAVELERAVNEASRFYADVNHLEYTEHYPYLHAPRLRVENDDGRNFLAAARERFDVVISEPSNPWLTGVSDLFTVDHFRTAKRRLQPGGVYCQWVQLYELSPENVKVIYRTFASQFRHVLVFSADNLSSDTVMLGSDSPLPLDHGRIARALALPKVAAELARAGVHGPGDVLARVLMSSRAEVLRYAQYTERRQADGWRRDAAAPADAPCPAASCRRVSAPLNTDDNALIEFRAPRDLIGFERYRGYLETMYAERWPHARLSRVASGFAPGALGAEQRVAQAVALLNHGRQAEAAAFLAQARTEGGARGAPSLPLAQALLDGLSGASGEPPLELEPPRLGAELSPATAARLRAALASSHDWLRRGDQPRALQALERLPAPLRRYAGPATELLHAYLLYRGHHCEEAIEGFDGLVRREPGFVAAHPELFYFLGRSHDCMLHFEDSVRAMRAHLEASVIGPALP